ncbi:MAG TPA: YggT family protein [Candidatus Limnocylindria bacterium]|nr:YggT family protein [Candidatus Limnocylindria bacterium]
MCVDCVVLVFLEAFINILAQALVLAIFVRVIMSWVPMRLPLGLNELVWGVTEPVLAPIRRFLPMAGGIDFSPLIALLLIQLIASVLLRVLPPAIPNRPF